MKTLTSKTAYGEARSLGTKNTRQLLERPTRYKKKFLPIRLMKELEGDVFYYPLSFMYYHMNWLV